jgi:hypothetical protein
MSSSFVIEDLNKTLSQHLPPDVAKEVNRLLYGNPCKIIELPHEAKEICQANNFDLQAYSIAASDEQTRAKRLVRIGIEIYILTVLKSK